MSRNPLYRDRLGKPVPRQLEQIWWGRDNLNKMRITLRQWRGGLAGAVAGASFSQGRKSLTAFSGVPIAEISALLEKVDALLAESMPQVVCQCRERYCPFCEGKKWLNACDARRISSQGQLSNLSESLTARQLWEDQAAPPPEQNSSSATTRLLWLLAGPPEAISPTPDQEIASLSAESSCCTKT
jgi:hypothetical protein